MASPYSLPVETILKVDENELLIGDKQKVLQADSSQTNLVSTGTQCENWKVESPESTSCNLLSVGETQEPCASVVNTEGFLIDDKHSEEMSVVIREWPHNTNDSFISNPKLIPSNFIRPISCNFQALPIDEKFFLQFDYKTRNKLKTKQRRLDPYYRSQERVRQRTVMRIKRQDPRFRAAEREKGRYRMRIKRLDPEFRSQERERQRERMKIKRSDPGFREKEREQQKSRLHEKRLDPAFKEKERAQDHLRMCIKKENNGLYSTIYSDKNNSTLRNANMRFVTESQAFKSDADVCDNNIQMRSTQAVFPENINAKILSIKPRERETAIEAFRFKKQRIFNFNFYNSSNEQWAAHEELCSKALTCVRVMEGNETFKSSTKDDTSNPLHTAISNISKEIVIKDCSSEKLFQIKPEDLLLVDQEERLSETTENHRFCLMPPCTEK